MKTAILKNSDRIRVLNDSFRSTFIGGRLVMTAGVDALPIDTKARVLLAVQSFGNFTRDNDPHREHDFGSIEIQGETYFFKIDYYALDMYGGSEDPADPRRQRACSPSCAPTSTSSPNQKGVGYGQPTTHASRLHCYQARRPGRLLA